MRMTNKEISKIIWNKHPLAKKEKDMHKNIHEEKSVDIESHIKVIFNNFLNDHKLDILKDITVDILMISEMCKFTFLECEKYGKFDFKEPSCWPKEIKTYLKIGNIIY